MSRLPLDRLEALAARHAELDELLARPEVAADPRRAAELGRERARLDELVTAYRQWSEVHRRLEEDRAALSDPELRAVALEELEGLERREAALEEKLRELLLPADPHDERNTVLEIRAGTGGEEAALFAADLFRMYCRYADRVGWKVELLSSSEAAAGGLKEVIALVRGERVYSRLRFEAGVHRVQRVPQTEAQGRIHTSTATVAVLPEADEIEVQIRDEDLEIRTAAASGPGGQGVNTTNSAVQILHRPTGILVRCQDERSQIRNRARALQVLRARLLERERHNRQQAERDERRGMVGTGERSEKIRTYNFPQNRVTDHRIGLTLHRLGEILDGDLDELLDALRARHRAEQLAAAEASSVSGSRP
ncbi:MAG: peptide chain release factor 1 [Myxococcota bacterium]|nr:peptide chain release factor 1 [Myxococcota bacterium]MDW8363489.1 peptide chain release factor 1 [Myxococcales bacterium]